MDLSKVSRVEVINKDRAYVNLNVKLVDLQLQDDERTLKIFIYEDEMETPSEGKMKAELPIEHKDWGTCQADDLDDVICPECGESLRIPDNTYMNMYNYHNSCCTITNCCGKLIAVSPQFSYTAYKYTGNATEDDWGRK